jgi:lipoprotein NlpD
VLQSDFGTQHDAVVAGQTAKWYGLNSYLYWNMTCRCQWGLNGEWFRDQGGFRVGQVLRVKPPEVQPGAAVVSRIESRPLESRPLESPPVEAPAQKPPPPAKEASSEFMWPAKGKILAGFAEPRSKGIDIDGKLGDPVVAAAGGRVTYTGSGIPGLGKLVVIKHDNGFITVYAHNRDILVKEQQNVARGQKIAELGSSDADRPKLHFQIRKGSAAVDPLRYLPAL